MSKDRGSTARRRLYLSITFSFLRVDRQFDVQAASLTFARFETQHASRATVSTHSTFLRSLRFSPFEATPSTPRKPDCFPHTILFLRSLCSLASTPELPLFAFVFPSLHEHASLGQAHQKLRPLASLPPLSHTLSLQATPPQPTGRGLSRDGVGIRGIFRSSTTAQTTKQPFASPDAHITSTLPNNLAIHAFNGGSELILYLVVQ